MDIAKLLAGNYESRTQEDSVQQQVRELKRVILLRTMFRKTLLGASMRKKDWKKTSPLDRLRRILSGGLKKQMSQQIWTVERPSMQ